MPHMCCTLLKYSVSTYSKKKIAALFASLLRPLFSNFHFAPSPPPPSNSTHCRTSFDSRGEKNTLFYPSYKQAQEERGGGDDDFVVGAPDMFLYLSNRIIRQLAGPKHRKKKVGSQQPVITKRPLV